MFVKSCQLCPMLWASWEELSKLCDDKGMVSTLSYHSCRDLVLPFKATRTLPA